MKIRKAKKTVFENEPTPERVRQASGIVDYFKTEGGRRTKRLGSILDYMLSKRQINEGQYAAGLRVSTEWYAGGFAPLGATDYARVQVDGGGDFDGTQHRIDNARKFGQAMRAIGVMGARAIRAMVLHEMSVMDYGRAYYGYSDRAAASSAAYAVLRDGLSSLEIHYAGGAKPHSGKIVSHMEEGAKPSNRPDMRGT
jgi:hypothetical protein